MPLVKPSFPMADNNCMKMSPWGLTENEDPVMPTK
jgi:hypothetical protein